MRKLKIGDWVNNSVPENFYECNFEQKVHALAAKIYYQLDTMPDATLSKVKTELCYSLGRIPKKLFKNLDAEQIVAIKRLWNWVGTFKIDKQPFEYFDFKGVRYFLPAENFANTSGIEWAMAMILYTSFGRSEMPNGDAIYELVTTLCRPAREDAEAFKKSTKWNGDVREEYNSILASERALAMKEGLEWGVVIGVKDFFESMLTKFAKKYEILFDQSDLKPLFNGGEGCIAMLEDVAEANIFGNIEKVYETNIDTIYLYLKHKKIKAEREEEDFEKRQREMDAGFNV
jgi:hypothetical protein